MNERVFTSEDQRNFSLLSGDYNPLHLDEVQARRLMFGGTVVHGMHALLWAIDEWVKSVAAPIRFKSLKADFIAPIPAGATVRVKLVKDAAEEFRIQLYKEDVKVSQIRGQYVRSSLCDTAHPGIAETCPARDECRQVEVERLSGMEGRVALHLDIALAAQLFPAASRYLGGTQIAELLALTRLVGMECPGLNSVFSGFSLAVNEEPQATPVLAYADAGYDERFSNVSVNVAGPCMKGKLSVFNRPPMKQQPSSRELAEFVKRDEFSGQRALIVGGSRGLGEVTSKVLAAGGADVRLTYFKGTDDALELVKEITENGGTASCFALDVTRLPRDTSSLGIDGWMPTHLYYFATPFIFQGSKGLFSSALFQRFCDYYVLGFIKTVELFGSAGGPCVRVFYPSTVAITEMPQDMGEYACAKAAGEAACHFLRAVNMGMVVYIDRLPRVATDQTATIFQVNNEDPVTHVLDIARRMQGP